MLSDIQISKSAKVEPIEEVAARFGLEKKYLSLYGTDKAKIDLSFLKDNQDKKDGKLILVSAITPTPSGEGKSTTTIGLTDALNLLGKKAVAAIREPSLGPVFGVKGGAAGGGYAQVNPMADLNLHFTGDIHAITTSNNLISAMIDNHIYQGNDLQIDPNNIVWKRCMDLNDRALRTVQVGLSSNKETPRIDGFNITVASEIMANLCLATSFQDLRNRLNNMLIAYTYEGKELFVKDLQMVGSLMVLLKDAIKPNIVQTLHNNMVLVHGGPFANIAHGANSIFATKMGLKIADYCVTEAGFGADLGAEKFLDIKCREAGLKPGAVVLVATIRALKFHGQMALSDLKEESVEALQKGIANLERHIQTVKTFGLPFVVAMNRFDTDTDKELSFLLEWAKEHNVPIAMSEVFAKGAEGGLELAQKVLDTIQDTTYTPIYQLEDSVFEKVEKIATKVYGAKGVKYDEKAKALLKELNDGPYKGFYIVMAKTPNSITDNAKLVGRPEDFTIKVREVRIATGAKFIICLCGSVMTMPGLPKEPLAIKIDIDENFEIYNLS